MKKININRNWKFKFGENTGDENTVSFDSYNLIALPHSFGIPYYGEDDFYVGYGCYVKQLHIEKKEDKRIFIEFGAAFQVAEIFVNGKFVGCHKGGYTAFVFDITDKVNCGENILFVRVNNLWSPTIAPRAGEHTFNGGLYRDVYLIEYPLSHIAWYGVGVKTNRVNERSYRINITAETVGCIGKELETTVFDSENKEVAYNISRIENDITEVDFVIDNPVLWDVENPYLYKVLTRVETDELITDFGIRTIRWTKDKGFFLNGKHVLLDGANVHQDHGGWGDAVTHSGIKRDISIIKDCGFNFIRGSHYPHHTEFARECDRQGILFWSENVFWGIGGFGRDGYWTSSAMPVKKEHFEPFEESLKQQLAEMIRVNRNSPSIICWSMGNEMFFSDKKVLQDARALLKRLVEYSHLLDDTRPAAIGGVQRGNLDTIGDVAGYNGDGAYLFMNPDVPNMVAEYGSIAAYRPGRYDLYETKGSDQYYDWRAGRCIWCGFHHGSIAGIGNLGICDLYRLPLNAYYCHRERLRNIAPPKQSIKGKAKRLEITADKTVISGDGTDDSMLVVKVLGNNSERIKGNYKIKIEVISGSLILPTGKSMVFSEEKRNCYDGMCAVEVRGYYAGKSMVKATCEGLESSEVEITVLSEEEYIDQDIAYPSAIIEKRGKATEKLDIIKDRPCTVSSEKKKGSSICLTSESNYSFWSPDSDDCAPHILLDLEHCYDSFEIKILKKIFSKIRCDIFTSLDKEVWHKCVSDSNELRYSINKKSRYIKINVNKNCKIRNIKIFSEQ